MLFVDYAQSVLAAASSFTQGWGNIVADVYPKPVDYYARNLKTVSEIYNLTVWPSTPLPLITHPPDTNRPQLTTRQTTFP